MTVEQSNITSLTIGRAMTDEKSNLAIQQPFPLKERIWYYIFLMDFQMDTHYDTFLRLTIVLSTQIYHSFGKDFFREISI